MTKKKPVTTKEFPLWYCTWCECEVRPFNVTDDQRHDERNGGCGNELVGARLCPRCGGVGRHLLDEGEVVNCHECGIPERGAGRGYILETDHA